MGDLRYAVRMLGKSPGFTAVAVLTLALGIGVNTAVFSITNALLIRPLPISEPDELVLLKRFRPESTRPTFSISYPNFVYFRDHNTVFTDMAASGAVQLIWRQDETDRALTGYAVSGNYFDALGVPLARGRAFRPEEDRTPGTHPVAVVSHSFWRNELSGDPRYPGETIELNGRHFTVVGIARPSFHGTRVGVQGSVWVPLAMQPVIKPGPLMLQRGYRWLAAVGRRKDGVSLAQADAEIQALQAQIISAHPGERNRGRVVAAEFTGFRFGEIGQVWTVLGLLMAAVSLVLLIACANVANLLLERASARRREIAVRRALGAGRGRLGRQFLVESLVLAGLGGAVGLLLAQWGLDLLSLAEFPITLDLDLTPDWRVLGFTFGLCLLTVLFAGIAPALYAGRTRVNATLRDVAPSTAHRRPRFQPVFVVAQIALCLVVLTSTGLVIRSFGNVKAVERGFEAQSLLTAAFNLRLHGYDDERGAAFSREMLDRVRSLPGVRSASLSQVLPLDFARHTTAAIPLGHEDRSDSPHYHIQYALVAPGYFETMGIPLVTGRAFTSRDGPESSCVAIVNEELAKRYWPGERALGKSLRLWGSRNDPCEVIGVARDGKYYSLTEEPQPFFYAPLAQKFRPAFSLLVRTSGEPEPLLAAIRREVRQFDASVAVLNVTTMADRVDRALFLPRKAVELVGTFGLLALAIATVGLYGVVACSVRRRRHEVGIRMALGARAGDVVRMVVGQGFRLVLVGVSVGAIAALAAARVWASVLFQVEPADPLVLIAATGLLAIVALLAAWLPARRAARIDPLVALRYE